MSDDGYFADSPYDEFEEMLWDADPGPNLADDLAQHAAYSPVWQDDPIGELEQYHSDWEYYSDDYFDDDPAILRNNPIDGSPLQKKNTGIVNNKRGRKRKFEETLDKIGRLELQSLTSTIRGTVWAQNIIPHVKVFQDGQHEKVALLTDWRERFQFRKKASSSDEVKLKRDESWANDLSLADMGLTHARESRSAQPEVSPEDESIDEQEIIDVDGPLSENDYAVIDMDRDTPQKPPQGNGSMIGKRPYKDNNGPLEAIAAEETTYPRSSKRSKPLVEPSQPRFHQDDTAEQKPGALQNESVDSVDATAIPQADEKDNNQNRDGAIVDDPSTNGKTGQLMNSRTSRKRRLSSPIEEEPDRITSTVRSRAKRLTSSKVGTAQPNAEAQAPSKMSTRSGKARKQ